MQIFIRDFNNNFSLFLKRVVLVFLVALGLFNVCLSQSNDLLEDFSLLQNENSIVANFSIIGGGSCNGVTLQRRTPTDTVYQNVGAIQGICGGSEFTEHYTVIDENPVLASENFYRLVLGFSGVSEEKSIVVVELVDDYTIYPQPSDQEIFIKFNNPNRESVRLKVYDIDGRLVKSFMELQNDIIFVNGSDLKSGIYIFQLEFSSARLITGKFIRS